MLIRIGNLLSRRISNIDKLGFDIVHGCQLKCVGCPNSTLKRGIKTISIEDFDRCLKNIDVSRVKLFRLFNFGEPLLHNNLPDILLHIRRHSFVVDTVEISTNAQHRDFKMLTEVFKSGILNRLVVSCDGDGTREEYERLRPPGKWATLLEFLIKAREIRDKYSPDLKLMTRTVCTSDEGRRRWSDLLTSIGWMPEFRGWLALPDSAENKTGRELKVPERVCLYMKGRYLYVDYDGTVVPCCVYPKAFELGNLRENRYSEILKGEKRKLRLYELKKKRKNMPVCGRCEV